MKHAVSGTSFQQVNVKKRLVGIGKGGMGTKEIRETYELKSVLP